MSNGPVEPSADSRAFAAAAFQVYTALTLEGFSEQQALVIIGQMIAANGGGGS
jgi:hypothetical protein